MSPTISAASSPNSVTRLGSMTTLWEIAVRYRARTPPHDGHPGIRLRALSEPMALDMIAHYMPDLEVLTDQYGNPLIQRCPTAKA